MMHRKYIFAVLIMVVFIIPVFALNTSYSLQEPGYSGSIYLNDTITVASGTSICAISGRTPWAGYAAKGGLIDQTNILFDGNFLYWINIAPYGYATSTPFTYTVAGAHPGGNISENALCAPEGSVFGGRYWNFKSGTRPTNTTVNFTISDSITSNPISNVTITTSSGAIGYTNPSGFKSIVIEPLSISHTFSLTKEGYYTQTDIPLGAYGLTGGNLNVTMITSGIIPTGYVRTVVRTIDALTGSQIKGTTINLRDVQNNSWVNSTADADGQLIIDVLESHTLDIYGSYPGVYTASQELGAIPGGGTDYPYNLPMYTVLPTPATGYVNVLTYVKDAVTDGPIGSATVTYTYIDGTLKGKKIQTITDNWGASLAVLKNASVVVIDTSKPNYNGQSESHTLPNFADVMYTVRLSKPGLPSPTVTTTDASGNVITVAPTQLPYCDKNRGDYNEGLCSRSQDMALFGQLREWGSTIMMLAILAIIFGLIKMIMKP